MSLLLTKKKCCCDDECTSNYSFETRNPCSSNALVATTTIYFYDAFGVLVYTATTNGSGVVNVSPVDLPLGTYFYRTEKTNFYGTGGTVTLTCGGGFVFGVSNQGRRGQVLGCNTPTVPGVLPGIQVGITGPNGYSINQVTDSSGLYRWFPGGGAGTYTTTLTDTSGRMQGTSFTTSVSSGNLCSTLFPATTLSPSSGYTCCWSSDLIAYARKNTLTVITSGGGSTSMTGCIATLYLQSDVVCTGGVPKINTCPSCSWADKPDDASTGTVLVRVDINHYGATCYAAVGTATHKNGMDCTKCSTFVPVNEVHQWFYNGVTMSHLSTLSGLPSGVGIVSWVASGANITGSELPLNWTANFPPFTNLGCDWLSNAAKQLMSPIASLTVFE